MSISDALNYPFRKNNLLKILPLALSYGIILYLMYYAIREGVFLVLFPALIGLVVFSLLISGYFVAVIQRLQRGDENLPEIAVADNVGRGCMTTLANLFYMLPLIIFSIVPFIFLMFSNTNSNNDSSVALLFLLFCGAALLIIPLAFILGAALQVALLRYADEESSNALFKFGENFGIGRSNMGKFFGLWLRMFLIGVLSAVVSTVINIVSSIILPQQNDIFYEPTVVFWLVFALFQVLIYVVSLIFGLSQTYLLAQLGFELGIGGNKRKEKEKNDFSMFD